MTEIHRHTHPRSPGGRRRARSAHGPQHGPAAPVDARRSAPGGGDRRRDRRPPLSRRSAICTPASRRPARPSSISRWFRSPTASTTSTRMANNLCYCLAVEKLLGLEIPEKAQWMRVLLAELTRLNSHLIWLGTHAMDIGALTVFLYTFREREEILRIFEGLAGQRMMTSYIRIGGLAMEPPLDFFDRVQAFIHSFPGEDRRVLQPAHRQPDLQESLEGRGLSLGRRCNCAGRDRAAAARLGRGFRSAPRYALLRLREVPVQGAHLRPRAIAGRGTRSGSSRCARASRSSSRRWTECRRAPIKADAPKIVLPDREKMKTQMEALIHHFKIVTEGFAVPAGEVYQGIECGPRADGLLRGLRRHGQALSRAHALSVVRHTAGAGDHVQGPDAGRRGGRGRVHRHCAGGDR